MKHFGKDRVHEHSQTRIIEEMDAVVEGYLRTQPLF